MTKAKRWLAVQTRMAKHGGKGDDWEQDDEIEYLRTNASPERRVDHGWIPGYHGFLDLSALSSDSALSAESL